MNKGLREQRKREEEVRKTRGGRSPTGGGGDGNEQAD